MSYVQTKKLHYIIIAYIFHVLCLNCLLVVTLLYAFVVHVNLFITSTITSTATTVIMDSIANVIMINFVIASAIIVTMSIISHYFANYAK